MLHLIKWNKGFMNKILNKFSLSEYELAINKLLLTILNF